MLFFLHADYMTDKLTIHDSYYKFHLNLHRQHHSKRYDKTAYPPTAFRENRSLYVCIYTQAHTHGCK